MTLPESKQKFAQRTLAIQDIFVVNSDIKVREDFNQTQAGYTFGAMGRHSVEPKALIQERLTQDGNKLRIIRFFVGVGFRYVDGQVGDVPVLTSEEFDGSNAVAEINARFAADYLHTGEEAPSEDILTAFAPNVLYHVWPYWREYIQAFLMRMRLPPTTLPMYPISTIQEDSVSGAPTTSKKAI
jgi:hypothetical protein